MPVIILEKGGKKLQSRQKSLLFRPLLKRQPAVGDKTTRLLEVC